MTTINDFMEQYIMNWTDHFPSGKIQLNCTDPTTQYKTKSSLGTDLGRKFMNSGTTSHLNNLNIQMNATTNSTTKPNDASRTETFANYFDNDNDNDAIADNTPSPIILTVLTIFILILIYKGTK